MPRARHITLITGLLALLLAACSGLTPAAPGAPGNEQPINTPVVLTLEEAESVAGTFLDAWARGDHTGMYNLVAFRSREAYPFEVFDAAYSSVADEMTLDSLTWRFDSSLRQGNTVAINYDVTFNTSFLGSFTDEGRTLRLIVTEEGWRVAWATTDIFSELAGGSSLILQRTVPTRANIYDRNGDILVDQYGVAIQVWVVQEDIPRWDDCFWTLTRVLRLSNSELQAIYDSRAANWETLVGEIDSETFVAERNLLEGECAATFTERDTRRYVSGGLAPHVIGYVGYPQPEQIPELRRRGVPEDAIVGITGVERSWDETLTGQPGGELIIISPSGDVLRTLASRQPGRSESVYLTIDSDLQFIVQQALSDAYNVANWGPVARGASAVIMDVQTGEILALASYPSYDPNLFNPDNARFDAGDRLAELLNNPRQPQINRVTQGAFAPGSVFKIVTMIASAESVYDLDRTLVCGGQWDGSQYGDILRDDWLLTGHGLVDLPGALTSSCDVYFYQAGVDLYQNDPDLLPNYAQRLGFGAPTGIQGLTESSGQVPGSQWARQQGVLWRLSDAVNMSIGQGDVLVTPLQMARLVAAVANGGDLLVPQVVHHAQTLGEEPSYEFTPTVERNINAQPETLAAVRQAMCDVTTDPVLGTAVYVFGNTSTLGGINFTVCGKTGTAQTGGTDTPPHAWFAAFTPAEEPQWAIVVMVENSREGSEVAAPIVRRILETYYNDLDPTFPPNWWPPSWWQGEYDPLETRGA